MSEASRKFKRVGGPLLSFVIGVVMAVILPNSNGFMGAAVGGLAVGTVTGKVAPSTISGMLGFIAWYMFAKHVLHTVA